jgi:ATP-binding cassette, subfamily B, bacterial
LYFILPRIEEKGEDAAKPYYERQDRYREYARSSGDTRIFGAFSFFDKLYYDNRKKWYKIERNSDFKVRWISSVFQLTKIVGLVGILLILVRLIINDSISAGEGAAVLASISTMYSYFENLFSTIKGNTELKPYIDNFFKFIDDTEEGEEKENIVPEVQKLGIQAENIYFTYPGTNEPAINGINLKINPGELIAVVGENGSGKTTLSKLLMGIYVPDEGEIKIGGRKASNTKQDALFSKTSAVFQDYIHYTALTLSDNVLISSYEKESGTEGVASALGECSLDISSFPQGLSTIMGKKFDGAELSGGQWQRVAMARGLYRTSEWLVLDEPTAAIDALEEDRMYRRFAQLANGKTAMIITHRLASARIANRIIVMDKGKIIEEGRHEELIEKNGKYAEMWTAQASSYTE